MTGLINTLDQLEEYQKKAERQIALLPLHGIFSETEKQELEVIYRELIMVCSRRIETLKNQQNGRTTK